VARAIDDILATVRALRDQCVAGLQRGLRAFSAGDLTTEVVAELPATDCARADEIGDIALAVGEVAAGAERQTRSVEGVCTASAE
jgi:HAMP domain-containing protein